MGMGIPLLSETSKLLWTVVSRGDRNLEAQKSREKGFGGVRKCPKNQVVQNKIARKTLHASQYITLYETARNDTFNEW